MSSSVKICSIRHIEAIYIGLQLVKDPNCYSERPTPTLNTQYFCRQFPTKIVLKESLTTQFWSI